MLIYSDLGKKWSKITLTRDAGGGGGAGGHVPPQNLGYQLTLFGPRGADYARHITTGPPIFLNDAASLQCDVAPQ